MITNTNDHFRLLPSSITKANIKDATLPIKVEAARTAIARCTDLPELLHYRDQSQGIAAAVKVMREVAPEVISQANKMLKEANIKLGELLLLYSTDKSSQFKIGPEGDVLKSTRYKSERGRVAERFNIDKTTVTSATRIALAPKEIQSRLIKNNSISPNVHAMAREVPRVASNKRIIGASSYNRIMTRVEGGGVGGLSQAHTSLKSIELEWFTNLTDDERKILHNKLVAMTELLDRMDQLCRIK